MNMMKKLVYVAAMLCALAVNARADQGVLYVKADATGSGDGSISLVLNKPDLSTTPQVVFTTNPRVKRG